MTTPEEVQALDKLYGTPCEQIRHKQEADELKGRVAELEKQTEIAIKFLAEALERAERAETDRDDALERVAELEREVNDIAVEVPWLFLGDDDKLELPYPERVSPNTAPDQTGED